MTGILDQYNLEAHHASNDAMEEARLVLEAIIVPEGPMFENLAPEAKNIFNSGATMTFYLWSCLVDWYGPLEKYNLPTRPGLCVRDSDVFPTPSEAVLRWYLQWIIQRSRRGVYAASDNWEAYYKSPHFEYCEEWAPFNFVVRFSNRPTFNKPTGTISLG